LAIHNLYLYTHSYSMPTK